MSRIQFSNFKDVEALLTSRGQKKIGNNTYLRRRSDYSIGLQYHATDVVTFTPSGMVVTSGGWYTTTTKERINWALESVGLYVYQEKGTWYLQDRQLDRTVFHDGIHMSYQGEISANGQKQSKETEHRVRIMKLINAYLRDFSWDKCGDQGGDCWYCSMCDVKTGEAWGDSVKDTDHLESHLKDKYYMTSLVVNAMKYSGYQDTGIAWFCSPEYRDRHDLLTVKRAMRKYFKGMLLDRTGE